MGAAIRSQEGYEPKELTEEEIKEKKDRLEFEQLLKRSTFDSEPTYDFFQDEEDEEELEYWHGYGYGDGVFDEEDDDDEYVDPEMELEKKRIKRKRKQTQLHEGDLAPTDCFKELVSTKSSEVIGDAGSQKLIPWKKGGDYLVIVADPRGKSLELRQSMKKLSLGLPSHIIENMIVINSDTPGENRKWMRRNNVSNLRIYSDEKMNWMKTYTMHGIEGLSIAIFIIADERVHKIAREVHGSETMEKLTNMVRSLRKK